jgi:catechol 2,3-dioxygenase-like lactoylglutathione lyase family enzyme
MANESSTGCGCPPTATSGPKVSGIHHVFLTVNDLKRSKPFYAALMPALGYSELHDFGAVVGWAGAGGSVWIKQADARYARDTFCKDRVGLCEVAFRAENREHIRTLAGEAEKWGGTILDQPREYPEYVPGYYAVFFADPDGIKLEAVHIPE